MFKRTLLAGIGIALLAAPLMASAASLSDLQAELASIIAQIQTLESGNASTSIGVNASSSASNISHAHPETPACFAFAHSLSVGSRGSDVTQLQQFLQSRGYLNVPATGYFGRLTAAAVGKWQLASSVVSSGNAGFGIFGPKSRSYFARNCGGTSASSQHFSADPQSGSAPLAVTFTTNDSINASTTNYSVDFGDGSTSTMAKENCIAITATVNGQGGIRCNYSVQHTYASDGTYTARLIKQTPSRCTNGEIFCALLPSSQTVGAVTITVGSSTQGVSSFTASPASGAAPLTVQFTSTAPQGSSVGNTVNFGDGSTGTLRFVPVCSSCNAEGTVSHTYKTPGTYVVSLTSGICSCPANGICNCPNMAILATTTIDVATTSTAANIVQLNAPGTATLGVNDIAEVRNESYYFTVDSLTASSATIQVTRVGCWNSFPSDTPPQIRCLIAVVPVPPQTLAVGQSYTTANYGITLTGIANNEATFSITASSTAQ